jgi:hypothetical protein
MRRLFRGFERGGLSYLLISGQASILYGAATFSEDIDIWIEPARENVRRLLAVLASLRASVYKRTPPLTRRYLLGGHGFHFLVPDRPLPIYLDVLGKPPRVGRFSEAARRARAMDAGWGVVPVVSPPDLVKLKLTRRLSDYEVISNLVRLELGRIELPGRRRRNALRWAVRNTFNAEDRARWLAELGAPRSVARCRRDIAREVVGHQARDTAYWRQRIAELRKLCRAAELIPEGKPVAELL